MRSRNKAGKTRIHVSKFKAQPISTEVKLSPTFYMVKFTILSNSEITSKLSSSLLVPVKLSSSCRLGTNWVPLTL